jgi:RNA recognition motif-containing protein
LNYKLFVRDFAPQTDVTDLENLFSEVGTVRKATLTERECNGIQRQVAYIEMSSQEEARDCIDRYHGMKSDGYTLTVTEDKIHTPDPNFSYKRPVHVPRPRPASSKTTLAANSIKTETT